MSETLHIASSKEKNSELDVYYNIVQEFEPYYNDEKELNSFFLKKKESIKDFYKVEVLLLNKKCKEEKLQTIFVKKVVKNQTLEAFYFFIYNFKEELIDFLTKDNSLLLKDYLKRKRVELTDERKEKRDNLMKKLEKNIKKIKKKEKCSACNQEKTNQITKTVTAKESQVNKKKEWNKETEKIHFLIEELFEKKEQQQKGLSAENSQLKFDIEILKHDLNLKNDEVQKLEQEKEAIIDEVQKLKSKNKELNDKIIDNNEVFFKKYENQKQEIEKFKKANDILQQEKGSLKEEFARELGRDFSIRYTDFEKIRNEKDPEKFSIILDKIFEILEHHNVSFKKGI